MVEIASTGAGKPPAPGLAMTEGCEQKWGLFARFCVAISSTMVEIASTRAGKPPAPGLAMTEGY
jgi:hypothetical protein